MSLLSFDHPQPAYTAMPCPFQGHGIFVPGHQQPKSMILKEYHEKLTTLIKKHPEAADLRVIAASDDEGNQFNPVIFESALGYHDDNDDFDASSKSSNAVGLN